MQTSIAVADGAITGTLKWLSSGQLVNDWGAGNFIALEFAESDTDVSAVLVGLENTLGAGMQKLDEDMDGVFKITNKTTQKLVCVEIVDGFACPSVYSLAGLTLNTAS